MLKVITVPAPVQLMSLANNTVTEEITFYKFLRDVILTDQAFAASYDAVTCAARIDAKFCDTPVGAAVSLSVGDYEKLVKAAKTPSGGRYAQVTANLIKLLSHFDAIIGAVDKDESAK